MVYLDRNSGISQYMQIYRQLLDGMLSGRLPAGTLLPGSRSLAEEIGAGRNTVNNAYAQLLAEGYVKSEPGLGLRVLPLPQLLPAAPEPQGRTSPSAAPRTEPPVRYDLSYSDLRLDDFPLALWRKYTAEVLAEQHKSRINAFPGNRSDDALCAELAAYLYETRGVKCRPEQILITSGAQSSIEILTMLLFRDGGSQAFEEPAYYKARFVFQKRGIPMEFMPLDASGAVPDSLPTDGSVKSIFLTPSHQFPMGMVMPIGRRYELLNWANAHDAYILEDDYDSEFCYYTNPIPSLQSIDTAGRVIYMGSFSKNFSPSMRMAFLLLPEALLQTYQQELASYNATVPWINQRVMAKFFASGNYARLVRRMKTRHKKSHDLLVQSIATMREPVRIIGQGAGVKFLLELPAHFQRDWLIERALAHGVRVYSPAQNWHEPQSCPQNLVMIGIAGIVPEDIPPCIQVLDEAWFGSTAQRKLSWL